MPVAFVAVSVFTVMAIGYLVWAAYDMVSSGQLVRQGLGVATFLLAVVGLWTVWATYRASVEIRMLDRAATAAGCDIDESGLELRPSGRVTREAADALFEEIKAEVVSQPDSWQAAFRMGRAYDLAGDRSRGREWMKKAADLYRGEGGV